MMKFNNKLFLAAILTTFLMANSCYAIVDNTAKKSNFFTKITKKHEKKNKQVEAPIVKKGDILDASVTFGEPITTSDLPALEDKKGHTIERPNIYTNDIHSVFSLQDCMNIAAEYNPQIRTYMYNALAFKTKIGQAWASYFPKLTLGLQGGREGVNYSGNYQGMSGSNTMGMLPTVSGETLLFDFGKAKATADSAKKTFESKESETQETINSLIYTLKTNYYNTLYAQVKVKVYEDTVADYDLQCKRAWSFYKNGKKAKIDVITAEYNLGKAKLNLVKAKNDLELVNAELSKTMGIPEYTNFELGSQLGIEKYKIEQEEAIDKAMEVRPELITAQKRADAAKFDLRAKKRMYTPDLGIFASYGNGLGTEYNKSSYQFGVGLNYNALNIAQVRKEVQELDAIYKKRLSELDEVKHDVYVNVKKAYLELKTNEEAIVISKLALDEATEQYRQANGRYTAGIGDIIELKDAESTYLNARLDFYNSLLNYNNTAAKLEKEIGVPIVASNEKVLKEMPPLKPLFITK